MYKHLCGNGVGGVELTDIYKRAFDFFYTVAH
jgi:hypothetical protein